MNGLKKAIIERLQKVCEGSGIGSSCSGGYSGYSSCGGGYSSGGGSGGRPRRSISVKDLTVDIYGCSDSIASDVDRMVAECRRQGKRIPAELMQRLSALRAAAKAYLDLVDQYTNS